MRILISNYSSAFNVLKASLMKLGHKFETADDGRAVLEALERPAGPRVAIIDSKLPGLSGLEVCRQIKEQSKDPRLYTIVMTSENDRNEVITALDSGADDYLQKPFDCTEVKARLQIAERILNERSEYHKRMAGSESTAAEAEDSAEKGEDGAVGEGTIAAGAGEAGAPGVLAAKVKPARPKKLFSNAYAELNKLNPFTAFENFIIKTLADMSLGAATVLDANTARVSSDLSMLSVILMPDLSAWLDIVLDMDRDSAAALFATMRGVTNPVSRDELLDMVGEVLTMIHGAIKGALVDSAVDVFTPVAPYRVTSDRRESIQTVGSECSQHSFSLPGMTLNLMLVPHFAPTITKTIEDMRVRDVVVEPVKVPGNSLLNLLEKGTMVTSHHLKRLREIDGYGMSKMKIETICASEISVMLVKA